MNTGCTVGRGADTLGAGGRSNAVYHRADDIRLAVPDRTGGGAFAVVDPGIIAARRTGAVVAHDTG